MRICDPCSDLTLFYLSLTGIDVCLSTVQTVIASQKVKEKQADCRISLVQVFRNVEKCKLVHVGKRCCNV
jgi:hypothetical protein